jgi:Asp-tRNA(Asn)/Glu-tRNA(Gln) amidotransferase A subunit family amidase
VDLRKLSLRELVAGIDDKRWSAAGAMSACTARIEAREPVVQAWEHLDLARALRAAEAADRDKSALPLKGVPVAVKDIIDVAGMPTRSGSPIYADAAPAVESAECVQALERAGAVVLGKSVTTEFAYYTPRKTRNPWNPAHTPGGSSMGSAASVACGMARGALGTQTNGSVVRPAAFCGVVGFKPSFGSVSNHGTLDPWPALDHTGVFARDVRDAALLASIIAKPGAVSAAVRLPARAPRLAVVRTPVWHLATPAQKERLHADAETLRHAGASVENAELPPRFADAHRVHQVILAYEGARHFRDLQSRHRDRMSVRFNALLDEGASIGESAYRDALRLGQALREDYAAFMRAYDAVLTPPAAGEAPPLTEETTGSPAFCTIWTLLGVPAITIPVGLGPSGLPLGLQIVGAWSRDDELVGIAAWAEGHLPFRGDAVTR